MTTLTGWLDILAARTGCDVAHLTDLGGLVLALMEKHGIEARRGSTDPACPFWLIDCPNCGAQATIHAVTSLVCCPTCDLEATLADCMGDDCPEALQRARAIAKRAPLTPGEREQARTLAADVAGVLTWDAIARDHFHHPRSIGHPVPAFGLVDLWASGVTELDGFAESFFHERIPDLTELPTHRNTGGMLHTGTCPRCKQRRLQVHTWRGLWYCPACQAGGGIVAFELFSRPERYGGLSDMEAMLEAGATIMRETLAEIEALRSRPLKGGQV